MEDDKPLNVIFKYDKMNIESFIPFEDGDFIIIAENNEASFLYDGKTFQQKLNLSLSSSAAFFLLTQYEYGIISNQNIELYNFSKDRTSSKLIQIITPKESSIGLKLEKLSNGDLLLFSYLLASKAIFVFRKNPQNTMYENEKQFLLYDLDSIIELNSKELLGYKIIMSPECLILKVLNFDDYKVKRENKNNFIVKTSKRKRIYLSKPIFKVSDNKLLSLGANCIFIFDINTLELETTIKFNKEVIKILIRPKGNILLFCNDIYYKNSVRIEKYFIDNIKINYDNNVLEKNEERDITNNLGDNKNIFEFYHYLEKGLAVLIDKTLIIYENY